MQHHNHPPHAVPPPHICAHHIATMNMAPPSQQQQQQQPQPPNTLTKQTQQHQHRTQHHLTNGPLPPSGAPAPLQPARLRDHHNRLTNQQQQHQPTHHLSTVHMQKLRQANLNNNINKSNYQQHQQPSQAQTPYNHTNTQQPPPPPVQQQHLSTIQQQPQAPLPPRNAPHHHHHTQQQQQPSHPSALQHPPIHLPHMKNHTQQTHHNATNVSNQYQQQILTQQHYYASGSKIKYNNNSNNNNNNNINNNNANIMTAPKSILKNPNRTLKSKMPSSTSINNVDVNTSGKMSENVLKMNSNNITITPKNTLNVTAGTNGNTVNAENIPQGTEASCTARPTHVDDVSKEANKENISNSSTTNENGQQAKVSNVLSNEDTAAIKNSKEKTPMCLVNELARFNKITHQYRLSSEKGPAHCKRFTVTLKLGEEEYTAEGYKIKKAQHLAAAEAIEKTKYKHPVPKAIRRDDGSTSRANITPTVELNALAMKLGQQTIYLFEPRPGEALGAPGSPDYILAPPYGAPQPPPPSAALGSNHMMPPPPPHAHILTNATYIRRNGTHGPPFLPPPPLPPPHNQRFNHRSGYPPRYHQRYPMMPPTPGIHSNGMAPTPHHPSSSYMPHMPPCKVTLIIGKQKFYGIGRTLQQAKHDAAARALQDLKAQVTHQVNEELNNSIEDSENKSPISLVHEIGIKRNMTVHFKVLHEDGPAHMKTFITACIVGSIVTEGEGNGKKISKKRAAEKMLEELKKLPPLTPTKSPVRHIKAKTPSKSTGGITAPVAASTSSSASASNVTSVTPTTSKISGGGIASIEKRKRAGASIKEKADTDSDENPITRLIQLQQMRKGKEPVFELIAKNGNENSRRREFIIEASAQGMVARGTGNSKKLAKRNAAQNLLMALTEEDKTETLANTSQSESKVSCTNANIISNSTTSENNIGNGRDTAGIEVGTASSITAPPTTNIAVSSLTTSGVPIISTPAGPVPGIIILRQNKKNLSKKKEAIGNNNSIISEINETMTDKKIVETLSSTTSTNNNTCINNAEHTTATTTSVEKEKPEIGSISNLINISNASSSMESTVPSAAVSIKSTSSASTCTATTNSAVTTTNTTTTCNIASVHMKEQLLYLAKLLGFEVNFSDYPKGNHNEFLTIVTLSTNPPQICHGVGTSSEESQSDAAKNALKILSELGLNNAKK